MEASRKETIECNTQFYQTVNSDKRIIVHQGGSRSGKTYAICQYIIYLLTTRKEKLIVTIARKTLPALKGSVFRDFMEIAEQVGIVYFAEINKAEMTFKYKNHLVEFISLDNEMKVRGRKRTHCFLNEANEFYLEDFNQLSLRTTEKMILDFNPSDVIHWIYSDICTRDDCDTYITTFEDNAFLDPQIKNEILRMKEKDADRWRVYGLGEKGVSMSTIFRNTNLINKIPDNVKFVGYGLDWGFSNDPTALIEVYSDDENIYLNELIYERGLTNQDIGNKMKEFKIERHNEIIADSSEPKSIEEIYRMHFNIKPAKKGADSVRLGIDIMRRYKINITKNSINTIKEFRNYKWKQDKNGQTLPVPVDAFNHSVDAVRYLCLNKLMTSNSGTYYVM